MRLKVISKFLLKKADLRFTKKLAVGILDEIINLCQNIKDVSENASIMIEDAAFLKEKIGKTQDDEEIKRRMSNLRDQVALRVDFMRDDIHTSLGRKILQKLDIFVYKTS